MIAQQIITIHINMINTIEATLAEKWLHKYILTSNHHQHNATNQQSNNLLQYIYHLLHQTLNPSNRRSSDFNGLQPTCKVTNRKA